MALPGTSNPNAASRRTFTPAQAKRGGKLNHASFTPAFHSSAKAPAVSAPRHPGLHHISGDGLTLQGPGAGAAPGVSVCHHTLHPDRPHAGIPVASTAVAELDGIAIDMSEDGTDEMDQTQQEPAAKPLYTLAQLLAGELTYLCCDEKMPNVCDDI